MRYEPGTLYKVHADADYGCDGAIDMYLGGCNWMVVYCPDPSHCIGCLHKVTDAEEMLISGNLTREEL